MAIMRKFRIEAKIKNLSREPTDTNWLGLMIVIEKIDKNLEVIGFYKAGKYNSEEKTIRIRIDILSKLRLSDLVSGLMQPSVQLEVIAAVEMSK